MPTVKVRLIPVLFLKNGLIVRSQKFSYHQNLGNVINEARRYTEWNVDELIYIDISRDGVYDQRRDDHKIKSSCDILTILGEISQASFMPLTFGGGIRTIEDIRNRVQRGSDKVTINTQALDCPSFISDAANVFGAQCIVLSVDYRIIDGNPIVFSRHGTENTQRNVCEWVKEGVDRGAGEVFLNSIDRDGLANGYDLSTIAAVVAAVNVPVVACGGAGQFDDFLELAQNTGVSGIAAGNIFHFTELAYPRARSFLKKNGINVRVPSRAQTLPAGSARI